MCEKCSKCITCGITTPQGVGELVSSVAVYRNPESGDSYTHAHLEDLEEVPYPVKLGWVGTQYRMLGMLFAGLVKEAQRAVQEGRLTPSEMSELGAATLDAQEEMERQEVQTIKERVPAATQDAVTQRLMGKALELVMELPSTEES